jgi:hypothetical protein
METLEKHPKEVILAVDSFLFYVLAVLLTEHVSVLCAQQQN